LGFLVGAERDQAGVGGLPVSRIFISHSSNDIRLRRDEGLTQFAFTLSRVGGIYGIITSTVTAETAGIRCGHLRNFIVREPSTQGAANVVDCAAG
jgi:hypothetical protein